MAMPCQRQKVKGNGYAMPRAKVKTELTNFYPPFTRPWRGGGNHLTNEPINQTKGV